MLNPTIISALLGFCLFANIYLCCENSVKNHMYKYLTN